MIANTDAGSTHKPSPGALRAAEEIMDQLPATFLYTSDSHKKNRQKEYAAIIDREMNTEPRSTGASELLVALKSVKAYLIAKEGQGWEFWSAMPTSLTDKADAAIAKGEPPTQDTKGD